ncbi:hypothetical protein [Oryzomicrobium terrae]|uniref:hypothetical protein n=1 Tax=Oryzomicrobium terrae TaxID=1735038 RepID=UPI0016598625
MPVLAYSRPPDHFRPTCRVFAVSRLQRFPHLSITHWGAFIAVVQNCALLGCEPFTQSPHLSPLSMGRFVRMAAA